MPSPGELAKQRGLDAVESRDPSFVTTMRQIAKSISLRDGQVTSDDLRRYAQAHEIRPAHPNTWGSIFRGPGWEQLGFTHSAKVTNRHRRITIWRWKGV